MTTVYTKNCTRDFCLFVYLQSYNNKSKFSVLQTVQSNRNTFYLRTSRFLRKNLAWFFSSQIFLYIEKNPVEKLCKVMKMDLKTYTRVGPKFIFEKIRFKVEYYIQHDFIRQHSGLSRDQVIMLKVLPPPIRAAEIV